MVDLPHGPRRVAAKNQVSLPGELLAEIAVEQGQDVWVALNWDLPGTLILMSAKVMERVFRVGIESVEAGLDHPITDVS